MNLLSILFILFLTLAVVVMVAERYSKPMSGEKQAKLSRIALILIAVLLIVRLAKEIF